MVNIKAVKNKRKNGAHIRTTYYTKRFIFNSFFKKKKAVFSEKRWKPPFEGKGTSGMKMNITFLTGNKILTIFLSNNFFKKSNILRENGEKKNF